MAISRGSLFPERDWGRAFKENRNALEGDIQTLQQDPGKLTIGLLENIVKHLQEIYKLLDESEGVRLIGFSIRYPLLLEIEEAYNLLKVLTELIKNAGNFSPLGLNAVPSTKIYEDSLILTKRLQSIDAYLSQTPQVL